jgi:hypothetical protein
MVPDREQRIRESAYRLWKDDGEPEGREKIHWALAEAMERDGSDGAQAQVCESENAVILPLHAAAVPQVAALGGDDRPRVFPAKRANSRGRKGRT